MEHRLLSATRDYKAGLAWCAQSQTELNLGHSYQAQFHMQTSAVSLLHTFLLMHTATTGIQHHGLLPLPRIFIPQFPLHGTESCVGL